MTTLNPDHLFEQAEGLIAAPPVERPRQADLRRAISSAHFGLFHYVLTCLADEFIGVTQRATPRYALVYRNLDHRTLKDACYEIRKQRPSQRYAPYVPPNGFGGGIKAFATAAIELQEERHEADYDPEPRFRMSDATLAVSNARLGVSQFAQESKAHQRVFLTLLLCLPR